MPKSQKSAPKQVILHYLLHILYILALAAFSHPPTEHKTLETANLGLVQCRNFCSVTVTGHLCQSVKLVQCVTVTGVCQIEQNGTVVNYHIFVVQFLIFKCICKDFIFIQDVEQ